MKKIGVVLSTKQDYSQSKKVMEYTAIVTTLYNHRAAKYN
jgi:hypothetical protein